MTAYRTVQDDVLDDIIWQRYQRTDVLFTVLDANPGLCEQPEKLPSGLIIELPDIKPPPKDQISVMD